MLCAVPTYESGSEPIAVIARFPLLPSSLCLPEQVKRFNWPRRFALLRIKIAHRVYFRFYFIFHKKNTNYVLDKESVHVCRGGFV